MGVRGIPNNRLLNEVSKKFMEPPLNAFNQTSGILLSKR